MYHLGLSMQWTLILSTFTSSKSALTTADRSLSGQGWSTTDMPDDDDDYNDDDDENNDEDYDDDDVYDDDDNVNDYDLTVLCSLPAAGRS